MVLKGMSCLFWTIMFASHLPAFLAVQSRLFSDDLGFGLLAKYAFLLVSVVYFLLKLVGVRFWIIDPSFDRMLVYCLIILLLHGGVLVEYNLLPGMDASPIALFFGPAILVFLGGSVLFLDRMSRDAAAWVFELPIDIKLQVGMRDAAVSSLASQDYFHIQSHRGPPVFLPYGKE